MNARLDFILPNVATNQAASPANFGCCRRYSPANDQAPEILGIVLDLTERAAKRLFGAAGAVLKGAASSRQ